MRGQEEAVASAWQLYQVNPPEIIVVIIIAHGNDYEWMATPLNPLFTCIMS